MKKPAIFGIALLVLLLHHSYDLNSQIPGFGKIIWAKEKIAPGLVWKSSHTMLNDSIPQNINVLIINTRKRDILLSYNFKKNIALSNQVEETKAIAAVNAGFFDIRNGGSVTYIRSGGQIAEPDTAVRWKLNSNMTGAVLIDKNGKMSIERSMTNSWYDNHPEYPEVLVTGPLLISEKVKVQLPKTPLVVNKHPRTVAGKTGRNKIVLVTLDGRTDQATGMTLDELADLMVSLHCRDAVNLDGGGSTTMWIAGKPFDGVVNMPCDNKKFDHEGERPVSDIIIIR
jgi:exopolysaccharide biosynthesis protein